jgi:hypothetical protein
MKLRFSEQVPDRKAFSNRGWIKANMAMSSADEKIFRAIVATVLIGALLIAAVLVWV